MSMGAEASGELLKYLQNQSSDDDQLEGLFQSFCEMVDQLPFKIHLVCFYETQRSDFSKVVRDLPPEFRAQHEKNEASGIVCPYFSQPHHIH
ncbi:hypothetical protein M434DRAFT_399854 [Hypoxylon sp. CO27-5]|nr:hypothetical protein M434DRAFT_399854 [Hypoxylon sp. CO27-5]